MTLSVMKVKPGSSGKKVLWIMLLIFALPIIAAQLILSQHWYQTGVTNKGVLISPTLHYEDMGMDNPAPQRWQVAYILPTHCEEVCREQLYLLQQSYIALGKDQPRVVNVVIVQPDSDQSVLLEGDGLLNGVITILARQPNEAIQAFNFVVIDPLGQWVMRYPSHQQIDKLPGESKDRLSDLRKLLTLSRVG
ncbi:SCO family protein [Vibrio casei]|nr:SCO family protein [Vibrio casei]SJN25166.1 Hypotehtical protein in Cytochrome oxidase biogenesis cluster [Vibrio casei]